MSAQRFAHVAFRNQAELVEREGAEGSVALAQEPGLELALDLEPQLALAVRRPADALEPERSVGRPVSPRAVLDPRLHRHPVDVDTGMGGSRAGNGPKHSTHMVLRW